MKRSKLTSAIVGISMLLTGCVTFSGSVDESKESTTGNLSTEASSEVVTITSNEDSSIVSEDSSEVSSESSSSSTESSSSSTDSSTSSSVIHELIYPTKPVFGDEVTVHDPSIFQDTDGQYYTYGSHFAGARSQNLIQWTQYASDGQSQKWFAGDWKVVFGDFYTYAKPETPWAPSVHKFGDKYYMYDSLSTFGSRTSVIVRLEATSPLGPFSDPVEIIRSSQSVSGTPNAIDPEVSYDTSGNLWLVYGSFSDGIHIKELYNEGANIGLPKDTNFGPKLWTGSVEGPFIFYNAETEYYYLMVSQNSLSTNYHMRVARSRDITGPYLDGQGRNVGTTNNAGMKLTSNFQFQGYSKGYAALGHNSVLVENGKYFNVYHTRYRDGAGNNVTGSHNQRTVQMFFNQQGWPVMSTNRYGGEYLQTLEASDVVGKYDILRQNYSNDTAPDTVQTFSTSKVYEFTSDFQVLDGQTNVGTWSLEGEYYVNYSINGKTYYGVGAAIWNADINRARFSITAISDVGISTWANVSING